MLRKLFNVLIVTIYLIKCVTFILFKMKVSYKKFSKFGHVPIRATSGSVCFDVYSSCEVSLKPGETKIIDLGIGFKFSKTYCCRIYPKPGLSLLPTFLGGGVVDSDYRGNISVILTNFSSADYTVDVDDKIAQIMFVHPEPVSFEEVQEFSDITDRGWKGFGSTEK